MSLLIDASLTGTDDGLGVRDPVDVYSLAGMACPDCSEMRRVSLGGTHQLLVAVVPVTDAEWASTSADVALRGTDGPTAAQMRAVDLDDALSELCLREQGD